MTEIDWNNNTKICALAWGHLHIDTTSRVAPCCQAMHIDESKLSDDMKLHSIHDVDIMDAVNSPGMRSIRKAMLANKEHYLCSMCDRMEKLNVESARVRHNKYYLSGVKDVVVKTNPDGSINPEDFNPITTDLRMSNLCNLKCRSCSSYASSSWHDEEKIIAREFPKSARSHSNETRVIKHNFIEKVTAYFDEVDYMYWAGGEPFILKEHYEVLQHLIDSGRAKEVNLAYNTNLTVTRYKNKLLYENYFKHFKSITIQGSLDGMNDVAEYTRTGATWQQLKENFEYLKDVQKSTNGHLIINPCITISAMNIHHLSEFIKFCFLNEWYDKNWDGMIFNFVDSYSPMCIAHLHEDEKQKIKQSFEELYEWIRDIGSPNSVDSFKRIVRVMFETQLSEEKCIQNIDYIVNELEIYNVTANLDWKKSLPLLNDYIERYTS